MSKTSEGIAVWETDVAPPSSRWLRRRSRTGVSETEGRKPSFQFCNRHIQEFTMPQFRRVSIGGRCVVSAIVAEGRSLLPRLRRQANNPRPRPPHHSNPALIYQWTARSSAAGSINSDQPCLGLQLLRHAEYTAWPRVRDLQSRAVDGRHQPTPTFSTIWPDVQLPAAAAETDFFAGLAGAAGSMLLAAADVELARMNGSAAAEANCRARA